MEKLRETIQTRLAGGGRLLLAIDGRCGCGKSTLAAQLRAAFGGSVFHTDDFYLPFAARAEDWREGIAGNMDLMRLRTEVLEPLRRGESVHYRAYDCPHDRFFPTREIAPAPLAIVEGSYSQHPLLRELYDLGVFVTASRETQRARLLKREGAHFAALVRNGVVKQGFDGDTVHRLVGDVVDVQRLFGGIEVLPKLYGRQKSCFHLLSSD